MEQMGIYKRPSAKEHCERVKFDHTLVEKCLPHNGFRLAYPKDAPGKDPDLYLRISKKSFEIFRATTGTNPQKRQSVDEPKKVAAKKKKKKLPQKQPKHHVQSQPEIKIQDEQTNSENEQSKGAQSESNWQNGDPQAEEKVVKKHLKEVQLSKGEMRVSSTPILPQRVSRMPSPATQLPLPFKTSEGNTLIKIDIEFCKCPPIKRFPRQSSSSPRDEDE